MRGKEVVDKIRDTLTFDEYEKYRFEKNRVHPLGKYITFLYY